MSPGPGVAVVGAGILGAALTLRLAQQGIPVTLFERAQSPGGLAGQFDWNGHRVDRFYHVIVPSDRRMIALVDELGLNQHLSFSEVGAGFFIDGKLEPLNGIADFARFSALTPLARARLASFVIRCQLRGSYEPLESVRLETWLRRTCGDEVTDRIWRPLLDSRFDHAHAELPATYLWARTKRMRGAREHGGGEVMGCLAGGHDRLVEALISRAAEAGAEIRLGAGVQRALMAPDGSVAGVVVDGLEEHFGLTIATLQPPALRRFLPDALGGLLTAYPKRYLGVVCLLLKVRRSLSPFYAVNICEPTPITTVVETSHVVGTEHTDGLRLIYLPKYCEASAPEFSEDDESIYARFTAMLARIAPDFRPADVVDWTVQRAPVVEPVHAIGQEPRVAPLWPEVAGLGLASASQIYPRLLNGESVVALAEDVATQVPAHLRTFDPLEVTV